MGRQKVEIEVKALHKRIQSLKAQRTEIRTEWSKHLDAFHKLDHDKEERLPKAQGKEFSKAQSLFSKLNHAIMGAEREYKEKCTLLISLIVE